MAVPSNQQIVDMVDKLQGEAVELLSEMVKCGSLLGSENSSQIQPLMEKTFKQMGLDVDRFPILLSDIQNHPGFSPVDWNYEGKENVVGTHTPKTTKGKSLIFNGHVDVVPTGPHHLWKTPPFQPDVRDGRLYGRGAGDMKGGVVAFCIAYKALQALGYQPASKVYFQSVLEEECTGNGTLACVTRGYKADAVIIPEPFPFLVTAQLGVMWLTISVLGRPVHVLDTSAGINAIEATYYLFNALKELEEKWNNLERPEVYKKFKHPINFNLGKIDGGEWASSVPCQTVIEVRVGFFPGIKPKEVQHEIESVLKEAAAKRNIQYSVHYSGFQAEGCEMPPTCEMMTLLSKLHTELLNKPIIKDPVTCTTDARFFKLYQNSLVTCFGPEATSIHGIDESVSLESLRDITRILACFMAEWCQLEPIQK
eukprot:TRINITY_DN824_c0_g1_i2.p1 TRINITY_DN824_c0_g1~~TRINITY_DN824_c0_g1_i2.p1  ORF type:complete len:424 (-),score=97.62 TRINITY_DN824_c0_g1_i2:158-1429(-)